MADRLNDTPEKEGLREAHGGAGRGGGAPQSTAERTGTRSRAPRVFSSQKGGEMKGHSQPPPHTVWFIGSSHTHTKYVHKHKYRNVHIYMGPLAHPGSRLCRGPHAGAGHEKAEPEEWRGPALLSQHPKAVLSLCSSAGRAGPNTCGRLSPRRPPLGPSHLALLPDSSGSSQPLCLSSPPGPGGRWVPMPRR